ncbi:hypothetical protein Q1695_003789 [Nippostrongylus brasiliensis]|nr:hypothetical protein Q1695_003789 [Nippostrongylus brasiliensis]
MFAVQYLLSGTISCIPLQDSKKYFVKLYPSPVRRVRDRHLAPTLLQCGPWRELGVDPCVEHLWFCLFCLLSLCHRARQGHQEVRFHDEENFMPSNLMDEAMKKCKKEAINDMLRYNAYTGEQCCRRIGSYHN